MSDPYIDTCCVEIARVLKPSGYLALWVDAFRLVEGYHLRIPRELLQPVGLCAWDSMRMGMGHRFRARGDYLLMVQRPPIRAGWHDHGIPDRWPEKVDRKVHPHIKPVGLIKRLIGAVTEVGQLVVDPAAGSFCTLDAARELGREFAGCDLAYGSTS